MHGLVVADSLFPRNDDKVATWRSATGRDRSAIDHILVSSKARGAIRDHSLLVCDIHLPLTRPHHPAAPANRGPNWAMLCDPSEVTQELYRAALHTAANRLAEDRGPVPEQPTMGWIEGELASECNTIMQTAISVMCHSQPRRLNNFWITTLGRQLAARQTELRSFRLPASSA